MRRLATAFLVLSAAPALAGGGAATSLCAPGEKAWFNATVEKSDRLVSLCGARKLTARAGWLQFRIGRPGAVEYSYPAKRAGSLRLFTYKRYTRFRFTELRLEFVRNGVRHVIVEGDSPDENPSSAVSLQIGEGKDLDLHATTRPLAMMRLEYKVRTRPYY